LQQLRVRQRIPQPKREPRGDVVPVRLRGAGFPVQEPWRIERQECDALDRDLWVASLLELPVDEELLQLARPQPPARALHGAGAGGRQRCAMSSGARVGCFHSSDRKAGCGGFSRSFSWLLTPCCAFRNSSRSG